MSDQSIVPGPTILGEDLHKGSTWFSRRRDQASPTVQLKPYDPGMRPANDVDRIVVAKTQSCGVANPHVERTSHDWT